MLTSNQILPCSPPSSYCCDNNFYYHFILITYIFLSVPFISGVYLHLPEFGRLRFRCSLVHHKLVLPDFLVPPFDQSLPYFLLLPSLSTLLLYFLLYLSIHSNHFNQSASVGLLTPTPTDKLLPCGSYVAGRQPVLSLRTCSVHWSVRCDRRDHRATLKPPPSSRLVVCSQTPDISNPNLVRGPGLRPGYCYYSSSLPSLFLYLLSPALRAFHCGARTAESPTAPVHLRDKNPH